MTDIAEMYAREEQHDTDSRKRNDAEMRRKLDALWKLRQQEDWVQALRAQREIEAMAVSMREPFEGRYLKVTLRKDTMTGKLVAEVVSKGEK